MKHRDELAKLQADVDGDANCCRIELQSFRDKKYKLATESHRQRFDRGLYFLDTLVKSAALVFCEELNGAGWIERIRTDLKNIFSIF